MKGELWAEVALTGRGWERRVSVVIDDDGRIQSVAADTEPAGETVGILLPAPVNLHSHAFQRAMAGRTERRSPAGRDDFWTWRREMYRVVEILTPDDVESITSLAQMEMLEAGFAAVAEFHYLHHAPGGAAYRSEAEMSERIAAAAQETGVGLTLLPVLYQRGGCDGREPSGGQKRFACGLQRFHRIMEGAGATLRYLPEDARLGCAPHSLRAVDGDGIREAESMLPEGPIHIHAAEQEEEVREVESALGARPVTWLLDSLPVDRRWCLIHCTRTIPWEVEVLARSGAVVGLCPMTEANLGDGIFDCGTFLSRGGSFGVGTDSNVCISLAGELQLLEYGQRLRDRSRARVAEPGASVGRTLFDRAGAGGASAAARDSGAIVAGKWADLLALDGDAAAIAGTSDDGILDAFIFAGGNRAVSDVWSAGRHVVRSGRHVHRDRIVARYRQTVATIRDRA